MEIFFDILNSGKEIQTLVVQVVSTAVFEGNAGSLAGFVQGIGAMVCNVIVALADIIESLFAYADVFAQVGIVEIQVGE